MQKIEWAHGSSSRGMEPQTCSVSASKTSFLVLCSSNLGNLNGLIFYGGWIFDRTSLWINGTHSFSTWWLWPGTLMQLRSFPFVTGYWCSVVISRNNHWTGHSRWSNILDHVWFWRGIESFELDCHFACGDYIFSDSDIWNMKLLN